MAAQQSQLDQIKSRCESYSETPQGLMLKPGAAVIRNPLKFGELFLMVDEVGGKWHLSQGGFFLIPKPTVQPEKTTSQESQTANTYSNSEDKPQGDISVETELRKLKNHFGSKLSQGEIENSIAFLVKNGLSPDEIATKTGGGRSTIYRCLLKAKRQADPAAAQPT